MRTAILVYWAAAGLALAQQYSGTDTNAYNSVRLDLGGSYGGQSILDIPARVSANVSLTPTSIFYADYSISSSTTQTLVLSKQFPVDGTFDFQTITTTLKLYSFAQALNNFGPAGLEYQSGTRFGILSQRGFESVSFQGEFEISSPNVTTNGTFNVVIPPSSTNNSMPNKLVDVGSYPEHVFLGGTPSFRGSNAIFAGVVDGVPITIRADGFRFQGDYGLVVTRSLAASIRVDPVQICWNSRSNKNYQVEYCSARTTNTWVPLGEPVLGNGGTNCVSDSESDRAKLYRIRQFP